MIVSRFLKLRCRIGNIQTPTIPIKTYFQASPFKRLNYNVKNFGLNFTATSRTLTKRMAEGTIPRRGSYPYYQALILDESRFVDNEVLCGGVIVSAFQVLSAAHCFDEIDPRVLKIRVGSENSQFGGSVHEVQKLIVHEDYIRGDSTNDLALLRVKEPFDYTEKVRPVKPMNGTVTVNSTIRVSGFGMNRQTNFPGGLDIAELRVENGSYCRFQAGKGQMCALGLTDYKYQGPCKGDEGGAVILNDKLAGIMVRGNACDEKKFSPLVFLEINHVRGWIDRHVVYDPENESELVAEKRTVAYLKTKLKLSGFVDLIYAVSRKIGVPISDYMSYLQIDDTT